MSTIGSRFTRIVPWLFGIAAAVVVAIYGISGAQFTGGDPLMPVDDAYIHFQYACQFASGQPFVYNPGQAPTSGGTSLIYPILLSAGCLVTGSTLSLGIWALALGACGLFIAAEGTRQLALRWGAQSGAAAVIAAATLVGGSMVWHAASGMETALVAGLLMLTLLAFDRSDPVEFGAAAGLLAVVRPEAAGLAIMAGILFGARAAAQRKWRSAAVGLVVPLAAAGIQPALNLIVTGGLGSSGGQSKSLFSIIPFDASYAAGRILGGVSRLWTQLLVGSDANGYWMIPPFVGVAAVFGCIRLAVKRNPSGLLVLGWWAAGFAAISTLDTAFWHFNRYSIPLLILAIPLLGALSTRGSSRVAVGIVLAPALFSIVTNLTFFDLYKINVDNVARQPLAMAHWIADEVPQDAVVAVHDVGLIRFIGHRTTLDMVGLTSPDAAESWRNGPGAVGEYLDTRQPDYIAAYTDARGLRYLADALYGPPVIGFETAIDPASNVALGGPFQGVYRPDWSLAKRDLPLPDALLSHLASPQPVDVVDVADIESEHHHSYVWRNEIIPVGFASQYYGFDVAGCSDDCRFRDGGRVLTGGESFALSTGGAGGLILLSLYHAPEGGELSVRFNGNDAGMRVLPALPGQFVVVPTRIENAEGSSLLDFEIEYTSGTQVVSPYLHALYRAADYSDESGGVVFEAAGVSADVRFARRNGSLNVEIDWYSDGSAAGDYRRFVHLYADLDQPPVRQNDAYPGAGAFPPGLMLPGVTSEQVVLDLAELPAGRYTLAIGMYASSDAGRIEPTVTCCWTVDSNRVLVGEVVVSGDG